MGDTLAVAGAFVFRRYVSSDWVRAQIEKRPKFSDFNNVINNVIAEEGWKIVLMLRLSPLPFNLVSYIFSVSTIDASKASTNPPALPSISHPTADVVIEEALPLDPNTGLFTRGERITLYLIGVITFLNIVVNVSLYYYFKSRNNKGP
ncbi:17745_t:CDS:2, partial [Gigaspora margarita]